MKFYSIHVPFKYYLAADDIVLHHYIVLVNYELDHTNQNNSKPFQTLFLPAYFLKKKEKKWTMMETRLQAMERSGENWGNNSDWWLALSIDEIVLLL